MCYMLVVYIFMFIKKILLVAIVFWGTQLIGATSAEMTQSHDKSQGRLIDKILEYLPEEARGNIDKKGMCNGLSTLWAYGMYLSDQPNPEGKERDDHEFFLHAQDLILNKPKEQFTDKDHDTVDRFIQHIIFFQTWAFYNLRIHQVIEDVEKGLLPTNSMPKQLELEATLEDTKGRKAVNIIGELSLICTKSVLQKRLNRLTSIPGNMVFIAGQGSKSAHIFSLYKNKLGNITFYDPNGYSGEKSVSVASLADEVWKATALDAEAFGNVSFEDTFFRNIRIYVYNFGETADFGNLQLNILEKEEMLKDPFLNKLKKGIKALPTAEITTQEYSEALQEKYAKKPDTERTAAIHSELLSTDISQRTQKIKGFILSGLPIRMDDVFEGFSIPNLISETDKIELIKLMLKHKAAQFNEWAGHRTGRDIESNISAFDEGTARSVHKEGGKGFLRVVAGKTSVFDFVLCNAIATGEVIFLRFLVAELPEAYRPSSEAIGVAIEFEVRGWTCPSEQCLKAIKYLTGPEIPASSKPEPYWLSKAKEHCRQKATNSWFSSEQKAILTNLDAILG